MVLIPMEEAVRALARSPKEAGKLQGSTCDTLPVMQALPGFEVQCPSCWCEGVIAVHAGSNSIDTFALAVTIACNFGPLTGKAT